MTEEEVNHLKEAYIAQLEQKDRWIEEVEALLMAAVLCIEELERRLRKDSHNSSKPPSSDGLHPKVRQTRQKSLRRSSHRRFSL